MYRSKNSEKGENGGVEEEGDDADVDEGAANEAAGEGDAKPAKKTRKPRVPILSYAVLPFNRAGIYKDNIQLL